MEKFRKHFYFSILAFSLILLLAQGLVLVLKQSDFLQISFLNVGQGDAIFIEAPNGVQILIDTGPDTSILRELQKEMSFFDKEIDALILTHPDLDHIGGAPEILKRFEVGALFNATSTKENAVIEAIDELSSEIAKKVEAGDRIILDSAKNIYLDILFPDNLRTFSDTNDQSVIVRLVYGEIEVLLTGDASQLVEQHLLGNYSDFLEADILKAGHHGSKTSSAKEFVAKVAPEYAVVSAGEDNRYGHPHVEVLETFKQFNVEIFYTYDGTQTFVTDGISLFRK